MDKNKTISEIIQLWKTDKKQYIKSSSFSAYALLIENHLIPAFGDRSELNEIDVQAFVHQKLAAGLGQKSVKDILIVLNMVLKFAGKRKWLDYVPFDILYPTDREKSEVAVLNRSDQKKVMGYVEANFTFRNLGIFMCLSAGMRIGEVCALKWEDVDTEQGVIRVRRTIQRIYVVDEGERRTELVIDTPKTKNSIRDIPMGKDLLRMLKPMKKIVNSSFFVLTNEARPTEPRTYRSYYMKMMEELKMPRLKFHGLRHSFATRCIESRCDYKTVSVLLGHSNITTTLNLYVHPNHEQKKKCIDQMFRALR
ncbi:tyrosine-type recombinase/integrase [Pedobacter sp. LMG 31464]|uniref:Tyrosine-type recombinase/integrase n=1 Tax=Pedobacter planticolens TaxID=2679964 RepID=A0A923E0B7_9SPHI|nr:site-specific integrase [Pedobacter planticolens]MBB2145743.1 tyrosine-type recombinase/integrase [Pedobacter planticolens]